MNNKREMLVSALEGRTPEITPLSIYDWNMGVTTAEGLSAKMKQDEWKCLIDKGLSVICHCEMVKAVDHGVETVVQERKDGSDTYITTIKRTPVGEIRKVTRNGWHQEDWIKEPQDYLTVKWIIDNTELVPDYDYFDKCESAVGNDGVTVITGSGNWLHRTPLMKINIDWAGTEQFCIDVAMEVPELFELYGSLKKQFIAEQKLIAAGPGRYVKWLENLTISMIGPDRDRDYLVPLYTECMPMMESAGKRVMVHYDGHLSVIADQIAAAPFHMIESLTEPPEGDMTYDRCRAMWPEKVFWANINAEVYELPPEKLRQAVREKVERAGRRGLAFEISEDRPRNWQESIPVVLDALRTVGGKNVV